MPAHDARPGSIRAANCTRDCILPLALLNTMPNNSSSDCLAFLQPVSKDIDRYLAAKHGGRPELCHVLVFSPGYWKTAPQPNGTTGHYNKFAKQNATVLTLPGLPNTTLTPTKVAFPRLGLCSVLLHKQHNTFA